MKSKVSFSFIMIQSLEPNFNPFKITLKKNFEEKQEEVRRKPKTLRDYRLHLVNGDKGRWVDNRRTKEKKVEIENIKYEKEMMDCVAFMRKIREINIRTQKPQLRKIEEELLENIKDPKERKRQNSLTELNKLL